MAELVDDPENQTDHYADDDAGNERKVERPMLPAVRDITWQAAQTKGKFSTKVENGADQDEDNPENQQCSTELLVRVHQKIVSPE